MSIITPLRERRRLSNDNIFAARAFFGKTLARAPEPWRRGRAVSCGTT
jgi:hypothetical protein